MPTALPTTLLLVLFAAAPLHAQAPAAGVDVDAARALFASYEAREAAADPALADLYCDTALIVEKRTQADGGIHESTISARSHKRQLREAMARAQPRGDGGFEYRDVVFVAVAGGVRVTATRHSPADDRDTPVSLLVGTCAGAPAIVEELSTTSE